ncbi:MAG: S-layer homology domain-containing protein [Veillonella dispar]|nr:MULTISPECIES: S-layer homology domain-containing protein [Veillonella]MBS6382152.1 S-layer homology domain-containing protein [Veillonella dispar]MDU0851658.1 S-layer homology domain-containing protein [Veillonella sp.]MDU1335518.1 S-layer homology domain-containing protein [Veillonella sp.]MDU1501754.1 S-layer homology domain-containing protein [Veillonella sp.]MDU1657541.1 S-layer homology domain-containing protein [Veillonella sp.]
MVANAADNVAGAGSGVAIGTGSSAQKDGVVAIGKGAHTNYAGGSGYANVNGDVVIGENATTHSYYDQSGSVAVGKNAYVENTIGKQDKFFAFNQTNFNSFGFGSLPQKPDKVVTGVAIGDNTYVRSGGTMVGSHNYRGKIGDITVNTDTYAEKRKAGLGVYSTTLGSNSFTNGTVATTTGALNVISSNYDGNNIANATRNFGATINGSLNSIESATAANNYSGIGNAVVGTANRTYNSNGSLIFGAGNEITNSVTDIDASAITPTAFGGPSSVTKLSETVRNLVKDNKSGGSTLAIGGGNKADYTQLTSMTGVNNTITGTAGNVAKLNNVTGYNNTITNASNNIVMGNDHVITADNTIAIGGLSSSETRSVANTTTIGYDAKASVEGGVALGYKSNATVDKGAAGYDISTKAASTDTSSTWKATASAVSVGDVANDVTRQITSVAAGTNDTDAVNVAQLKKVETKISTVEADAKKHTTVVAGANTTVTPGTNANGGAEYKVAVNKDLVEMSSANFGKATDDVRARIDKDSARFFNGSENIGITPKGVQIENTDTLEQAKFDKYGMYASEGDKTVYYTTTGISAGDQIINNVKAGVADTDAVNVSQLKRVQDQIAASTQVTTVTAGDHIKVTPTVNGNTHDYKVSLADDIAGQITNNTTNINKNTNDIKNIKGDLSKIDKRVDKSVAGAAALAALHPLDFDPDAKWDFAAGYGHYRSGDAAAIGAFYRPNEDVQLSVGSTVGSDETVFNAGLSVKVGAHSGVSRSRVAIGKEVLALKKTVAEQNAQIQKLTTLLNGVAGTKMKADHTTLFPDIPTNHWAYEAVSDLSRRGLVEGYPDGTFGGDRMLTRYEFAQIVYRAIQDGVTVNDRLVTEFSPEMALFRVDTVAKNAKGEPTIERVRVNKK